MPETMAKVRLFYKLEEMQYIYTPTQCLSSEI